jgi:hypothetical protein
LVLGNIPKLMAGIIKFEWMYIGSMKRRTQIISGKYQEIRG